MKAESFLVSHALEEKLRSNKPKSLSIVVVKIVHRQRFQCAASFIYLRMFRQLGEKSSKIVLFSVSNELLIVLF
jgi:hypothetical protein